MDIMTDKFKDMNGVLLQGHIKITDPGTGEVLIDKRNAIHYENMSIALAESLASAGQGPIYKMAFVSCLLDYGEPSGQDAFDTASDTESLYVFDELGLVSSAAGTGIGKLLTHVIFHPVQKSLNRLIQIDYTVRVQSLTGFNEA